MGAFPRSCPSPLAARARALLAAGALIALGPGCRLAGPGADITIGQTLLELTDAVNSLRFELGVMQDQMDSLRVVVARQDSAIARLSRAAP
jgi:hypothetical protein